MCYSKFLATTVTDSWASLRLLLSCINLQGKMVLQLMRRRNMIWKNKEAFDDYHSQQSIMSLHTFPTGCKGNQ